jgi:hypothetical protein
MTTIIALYVLVVAAFAVVLCSGHARAQSDFDRERYHRAVEYCRGSVSRPMALSPDRQILCLDGDVEKDLNVSPAWSLEENGLFVEAKIFYEAYPESQEEVNEMAARHGLAKVIYDP